MMFKFLPYMKLMAINLVDLSHTDKNPVFNRASGIAQMEEHLQMGSYGSNRQLICIDGNEGSFIDNLADNVLDNQFYTYCVVEHVESLDFEKIQEAKERTKIIAKKIMGKMFWDKRYNKNGLRDLDRASIHYFDIGPIGYQFHGTVVNFTVLNHAGVKFNIGDFTSDFIVP